MKAVLITGATSGIGRATAIELARKGFVVAFIARDPQKAEDLKKEIRKVADNDAVFFIQADLSSLEQVRHAAAIFNERFSQVDVLINNAGLVLPSKRITADGMEETFEVNYLSHFLLTNILLKERKMLHGARIINVSSGLYKWGVFDPSNLQGEKSYSPSQAYDNTKLMNILFTLELADRLKGTGVTVNAVHPGVVRTNFGNEQKGVRRVMIKLFSPFFLSPEKGAETSIYLATSEDLKDVTGKYFEKKKIIEPQSKYLTEENRKILWEKSMELSGLAVLQRDERIKE